MSVTQRAVCCVRSIRSGSGRQAPAPHCLSCLQPVSYPSPERTRSSSLSASMGIHLVGAPLRCRRRACGGGSPCVESLYRSLSAAARCPRGAMEAPAFYFVNTEVAAGFVEDGWLDRARGSHGGGHHRRRGSIRDRGCSGCSPGRRASRQQPHLVPRNECLLRLLSKRLRDGAPSDLGGGSRSRRSQLVGISGAFDAQGLGT